MKIDIESLSFEDRPWVRHCLEQEFGSACVVSRGVLHRADMQPGFKAALGGTPAGLITYDVRDGAMEVTALVALSPGMGIGEALLDAARLRAKSLSCKRLWLITTNDNTPAQRLYQRWGLRRVAVHAGAVAQARRLKPEIPSHGVGEVPIEDEWEYEIQL